MVLHNVEAHARQLVELGGGSEKLRRLSAEVVRAERELAASEPEMSLAAGAYSEKLIKAGRALETLKISVLAVPFT